MLRFLALRRGTLYGVFRDGAGPPAGQRIANFSDSFMYVFGASWFLPMLPLLELNTQTPYTVEYWEAEGGELVLFFRAKKTGIKICTNVQRCPGGSVRGKAWQEQKSSRELHSGCFTIKCEIRVVVNIYGGSSC